MKIPRLWRTSNANQFSNQRGDTILEVLIATTLVAAILGGAYVTVRANLNGTEGSQERSEALKLAETQVEELRVLTPNPGASDTEAFCFTPPPSVIATSSIATATFSFQPSATYDNPLSTSASVTGTPPANPPSVYDPECEVDSAGAHPPASSNPFYIGITFEDNPYVVYTVHVRWSDLNGGTDEVSLAYRIPVLATTTAGVEMPVGGGGAPVGGGGGGTPTPGGNSNFSGDPCTTNPTDPRCPPSGGGGGSSGGGGGGGGTSTPLADYYNYQIQLFNTSNNPGVTVLSCDWDWGDGTITHTSCNYGDEADHCYAFTPGNVAITPDVTLTMHLSNGANPFQTYPQPPVPVVQQIDPAAAIPEFFPCITPAP